MGKIGRFFQVVSDVTSLGGTYRLRTQNERYQRLRETYDRICTTVSRCNAQLLSAVADVQSQVRVCTRRLKVAYKVLNPLGTNDGSIGNSGRATTKHLLVQARTPTIVVQKSAGMNVAVPPVLGAGAGGAVIATSWTGAQLLAHASTGTAIVGLHGIAATNASWALFGGGSLAAGGGGMAAGHLVLPGIGTAVAVAVSATLSHREANKVAKLCDQLGEANRKNSAELSRVQSSVNKVCLLRSRLNMEREILEDAIRTAQKKVRRFGWFSHLRRLLRYWIWGYYYTQEEFRFVKELDAAFVRFIEAFKSL